MAKYITVICRVKGETVLRLTDDFNYVEDKVCYHPNDCEDENSHQKPNDFNLSVAKKEVIEEEVNPTLDYSVDSEDYNKRTQTFNYIWSGLKTQSNYDNSNNQMTDEYKKHLTVLKGSSGRHLFVCRYKNCKYQTLWENTVINHIRSKHLLFFPFVCEKCGKKFAIPSKLKNHIKRSHLKCDQPFEESSQSSADMNHNYSQKFVKKKTFFKKKSNNFRKSVKHFGRQKTNIPNDKIKDSQDLKSHSIDCDNKVGTSDETPAYVGIKSVEKYIKQIKRNGKIVWRSCMFDNCSYGTKYATSIVYHIRDKHLNDKPYVCTVCGNRFAMRTNLNHHKKIHKSKPNLQN